MTLSLRGLRSSTITYSRADLLAVGVIAATVAVWVAIAGGVFSVRVLVASEVVFFGFYGVGSLFASSPALADGILFGLPLRLLIGYGVVNTALLVLAWFSPLGLIANGAIVLLLALVLFFAAGQRQRVAGDSSSLWVVAICLAATWLWCQDSIAPRVQDGGALLFKPWVDGFYHAVHIRIFAASHGAASIEDWRLAGEPARPYHYAMYLLPALIKRGSGIDSYTAFAAIL